MKNRMNENPKVATGVFGRIMKKDFSGNAGQAIKNSGYQIAAMLTAKIGALSFMVIIARLFAPEIFGLYGLTLSTLVLFGAFSDWGISTALLTYLSKKFGQKDYPKAKGYYVHLLKYKLVLLLIPTILLLSLSGFISGSYYQKPIFYALLAGILYLPANGLVSFFSQIFIAGNNFKTGFIKEIIFQIIRLVFVPLTILVTITRLSPEFVIFWVFLVLGIIYVIIILFLYLNLPKEFKNIKPEKITSDEKRKIRNFILPLSVTALSGVFLGSIDMIMLGRFVSTIFIGYYQAAFGLISAASALLAFSGAALFPIFSRLKREKLEKGLKKGLLVTLLIVLPASIFTILIAPFIIHLIYGAEYLTAVPILRIFSLLLISIPLASIYNSYYISQGDTKRYAILIVFSALLNIVLNYIFISSLLPRGMLAASLGAGMATIVSGYVYLLAMIIFRRKSKVQNIE
jgi:O-antigen/teichoic acid export membrane protein